MVENSENVALSENAVLVGVAIDKATYSFDRIFEYIVPSELIENANSGCRVVVPFGRGNRQKQAMIMYKKSFTGDTKSYKMILKVLDEKPVLSNEMLSLVEFMKNRYYCTMYDCICAMLPVGINYKFNAMYSVNSDCEYDVVLLDELQRQVYDYLVQRKRPVSSSVIFKDLGLDSTNPVLHTMSMMGVLDKQDEASRRIGDKLQKMIRLTGENTSTKLTPKQGEVYEMLNVAYALSVKELCYYTGCTQSVVDALVKKGMAEYFETEVFRTPAIYRSVKNSDSEIKLTLEQQMAYDDLTKRYKSGKGQVSLLYGVTGSGKTSVFMRLIDTALKDNKGVIVMVPEIALTPQLINLFTERYGQSVAVFHSGLSVGERLDEWKRVKNGYAKIAVGTRSAVFAPFDDIGLIIMDEEQEYTYKSESNPRFHARDIAKYRCNKHNCLLLLASATPSIESFYNCQKGRYSMNKLTTRYGNARLPRVIIADMNEEQQKGNYSGVGSVLLKAIEKNLEKGRQSIILLNRRGYNTFVSCKSCNEVVSCPNCSISLTYHSDNNRLMCHYCGYSEPLQQQCPVCKSYGLRFSGLGTQRAEQTLMDAFPNAKILRLDADSTIAKFSHEKKLSDFSDGKYDIMIGTQMVAKGLNFPNVTLVGVLSADQMLYSDDYRSYERAFSLLTQVVGRSGRGDLEGSAIIQTFTPDNPTILLSAKQDYDSFYKNEILLRKAMLYPPFSDICMVGFVGENEQKTENSAQEFTKILIEKAGSEYSHIPLRVLGYSSASINRINNKYRYKCVMKFRNSVDFRKMLSELLIDFSKDKRFNSVTTYVDINPDTIL
ncbi:MAG: primosomal protein N' [Acutalibacteraceae bacterium]|nr:primosomal protein N' [Acutalibacteraceae bacterium]